MTPLSPKRKGRITASSVGAIMGFDPFRTRADVMRQMVRDYHGAEPEFTGNVATRWGTFSEAGAIEEFKLQTMMDVEDIGFEEVGKVYGATPDGLCSDGNLLEVKCPYSLRKGGVPTKTAQDQKHYYAQMQFQMWCCKRDGCWFWQWSPEGDKVELVERDEDFILDMLDKCMRFWTDYIIERDKPEDYVRPLRDVIEDHRATKWMMEYLDLNDAISNAKAQQAELLDKMVKRAKGRDCEIGGHNIQLVKRKGSVSYKKAIDDLAPDADLSTYTGKSSEFWKVT